MRAKLKNNIESDKEYIEKLKLLSKDYKNNKFEIFNLLSDKIDKESDIVAELLFLEFTKNFAYIDEINIGMSDKI